MRVRIQLIGALLTLALAEGAARFWLNYIAAPASYRAYALYSEMPRESYQWAPHPYLAYIPRPGYRRGKLSHNSLGFRGDEFPAKKPAGTFRIAILGGSTVYGVGIEDNAATFPAQLERVLREEYHRDHVQVINAGAGAYTSWESLADLEFRILDLAPDLVIIYHGVNDVHSRLVKKYRSDNTGRRKSWTPPETPWWERSTLLRIISRKRGYTRQAGLEDFVDAGKFDYHASRGRLAHHPPVYFDRNLRSMIAVARMHGVEVMLATWAHTPAYQDYAANPGYQLGFQQNNETVKKVGSELKVPVLDFAAAMPTDRRYWHDGRHVNEAGATRQANIFASFLIERTLIPE